VTSSSIPGIGSDDDDVVSAEIALEAGLRPRALDEFVGQRELKEHLRIVLEAARSAGSRSITCCSPARRGSARPPWPASSPPRWGSAPPRHVRTCARTAGDLAAILTKLEDGDVLFIDEIHRLSRAVEEILYPAMEDFQLDIVVGKGPAASSIRLTMPPFTLVGATTRTGMITGPLRDRFGLVARLDYYDDDELRAIVERAAASSTSHRHATVRGRSPAGRGARRASPTGSCDGSATSPRCATTASSTADIAREGLALFGVDDRGPRQGRPGDPVGAVHSSSTAVRSGCRPWRSASASSPRRSRTSTSRS
jgi:holliday junction DNA helicase RuvB